MRCISIGSATKLSQVKKSLDRIAPEPIVWIDAPAKASELLRVIADEQVDFCVTEWQTLQSTGNGRGPLFTVFPPTLCVWRHGLNRRVLQQLRYEGAAAIFHEAVRPDLTRTILSRLGRAGAWRRTSSSALASDSLNRKCFLLTVGCPHWSGMQEQAYGSLPSSCGLNCAGWYGRIYVTDGKVVHAETPGEVGGDAIRAMQRLGDACFRLHRVFIPPRVGTLSVDLKECLMQFVPSDDRRIGRASAPVVIGHQALPASTEPKESTPAATQDTIPDIIALANAVQDTQRSHGVQAARGALVGSDADTRGTTAAISEAAIASQKPVAPVGGPTEDTVVSERDNAAREGVVSSEGMADVHLNVDAVSEGVTSAALTDLGSDSAAASEDVTSEADSAQDSDADDALRPSGGAHAWDRVLAKHRAGTVAGGIPAWDSVVAGRMGENHPSPFQAEKRWQTSAAAQDGGIPGRDTLLSRD